MRGRQKILPVILALVLAGITGCAPPSTLQGNDKAQMETARLELGLIDLRYIGGADVRIKAQISGEGKTTYNYDLNGGGDWETFSFPQGDGTYTVKVLENTTENRYQPVYTTQVTIALSDPKSPFLYPNQFVHYREDSPAVKTANELMTDGGTDAQKAALAFDYVVDHLTYDHGKERSVKPGYLPDVDAVLAQEEGICFDYAALLCAMCRSQGIPCKLMVGYAGTVYHAWVEVYCENSALVDNAIPITAGEWSLLDPTFVSSNGRSQEIMRYVTDSSHYKPSYIY